MGDTKIYIGLGSRGETIPMSCLLLVSVAMQYDISQGAPSDILLYSKVRGWFRG